MSAPDFKAALLQVTARGISRLQLHVAPRRRGAGRRGNSQAEDGGAPLPSLGAFGAGRGANGMGAVLEEAC